jgi:hypothetical protein
VTVAGGAEPPSTSPLPAPHRGWLRFGSVVAFAAVVSTLVAAVAGGITEPTGIAAVVAVITTVLAYGIAPLLITVAMRQSGLSSWWAVVAALLAAALWSAAALLFARPDIVVAPAIVDALVSAAPSASGLWILVASVEAVRAGLHRWSLVVVAGFLAVLIVGSVLIELSGFDIRRVLVPLGWAVWMIDVGNGIRSRMFPVTARTSPADAAQPCTNCGAPRRKDGLAFCGDCGLPYGSQRT